MQRMLTGICLAVWCAMIVFKIFRIGSYAQEQDTNENITAYFSETFNKETKAQIHLSGSCPSFSSEEEIVSYLKGAAVTAGIQSGYSVIKKQEIYGCIWELKGANEYCAYSLKYLKKNDSSDEGAVSWKITGGWSEKLRKIYDKKETLEEYSKTTSALCMEISGYSEKLMTQEEIESSVNGLMDTMGIAKIEMQQQDNLYLYYGYKAEFGEGVKFQGKKTNINLMYRLGDRKTKCIMGFPLVQWD